MSDSGISTRTYARRLNWVMGIYIVVLVAAIFMIGVLEQLGIPNLWLGYLFFVGPLAGYVVVGVLSRPTHLSDFYVAGRQVPSVYNGIATAASWVSAASFVGMAGSLYILGYDGLAFILGWTAGFVLLAVLIAPYLRRSDAITVPEFLARRYDSEAIRCIGIIVVIACLFAYLVAQLYACGIIISRFIGLDFTLAIYIGFGITTLCTVIGGMRSASWTQVAQYVVMVIAYLVPLTIVSMKKYGLPVPYLSFGMALQDIAAREQQLVAEGLASAGRLNPHVTPFQTYSTVNFVALAASLMFGTAVMPHILTRFATTPDANAARTSAFWTLAFVLLLYLAAPAYAAFAKLEVFTRLIGRSLADLPMWVVTYGQLGLIQICGKNASTIEAIRAACAQVAGHPGVLRHQDMLVNTDVIVLSFAESSGLPYVISGLFAAGAIAAAISTASALLVTMSTSLSHDLYYRLLNPRALPARRLQMSRLLIIAVAAVSAWAASLRPAELLIMVSWSFSLAASSLFAPLVLGIWWRRTSPAGAITGMIAGFAVCLLYLVVTRHFPEFGVRALGMTAFANPVTGAPLVDVQQLMGRSDAAQRLANSIGWLDIRPISAAVFGVPVALAATVIVSRLTWRRSAAAEVMLEHLRNPEAPVRVEASETARLN